MWRVYAATDWFRLAQKLRGDASPCADYYISVPPVTDKTQPRTGEASRIRGLGPHMHAMAEINWTSWAARVAATGQSWFDSGVEARRRMKAAGYDVTRGDIWAVNELPSSVRRGDGLARQNVSEFVRGLYTGDGIDPPTPGLVWMVGIGQSTPDLSVYKANVKAWFQDTQFWSDMSQYVRFFSQEVFGDAQNWAVPGADLETRRQALEAYLEHLAILTQVAPDAAAAARSYFAAADAPLANAAWSYNSSFGFTAISTLEMRNYISTQTLALRPFGGSATARSEDAFGFVWTPRKPSPMTDAEFARLTADLLDRLANAIHLSDTPTDSVGIGACGDLLVWCGTDLAGAAFNDAWQSFGTWTAPLAVDSSVVTNEDEPVEFAPQASDPDGDALTYTLVDRPTHGDVELIGLNLVRYTPAPGFGGDDRVTFTASDGHMSSRLATVSIHLNQAPTALEGNATVDEDSSVSVALQATDRDADTLTYSIVSGPAHGTLSGTPPALTYVPEANFNGQDSFTFRANDGRLDSTPSTFTIDVKPVNDPPTVQLDPAGPLDEGAAATLNAQAIDIDGDTLSYAWSADGGVIAPSGSTASFTADDGPATARVTVVVSDGNGGSASASQAVEIRNVAPGVNAGADVAAAWGVPVVFAGSVTDPSAADTRAGLGESWTFGDSSAPAALASVRHAFDAPGSYTATFAATDKDGASAADTASASIGRRAAALAYTGSSGVVRGAARLSARLDDMTDAATARAEGHAVTFTLGSRAAVRRRTPPAT